MPEVKCQTIVNIIEELAPKKTAESWDNVGLLVGETNQTITKIMVCLDAADWVINEAIEKKVDMIVCHHPLIFNSIKRVNNDTLLGKKILKLIKNNIALYCCHTNYDLAVGGLNDILANKLGYKDFEIIEKTYQEKTYKVVVFVPASYEDQVFTSMTKEGAGYIGKYNSCSFRTHGTGTYRPEEGSKPFFGTIGAFEKVEEYRLETIVSEKSLNRVIREMIKAHPYEEPAYDIYEIETTENKLGFGRMIQLEEKTDFHTYANQVKNALGLNNIKVAGDLNKKIKKVAIMNGSGNKFAATARFAGADVLITGDVQYHEMLDAVENGLCIIDAGHFGTEKFMMNSVAQYLCDKFAQLKFNVDVIESKTNNEIAIII